MIVNRTLTSSGGAPFGRETNFDEIVAKVTSCRLSFNF